MLFADIKNDTLRELAMMADDASATIGCDMVDALEESKSDEELIDNWQSKLEELKHETERYSSELEKMKVRAEIYIKELKKPDDIIEVHKTLENIFGE